MASSTDEEFDSTLSSAKSLQEFFNLLRPADLPAKHVKLVLRRLDRLIPCAEDETEIVGEQLEQLLKVEDDTLQERISLAVQLLYHFLRRLPQCHRHLKRVMQAIWHLLHTSQPKGVLRANLIVCLRIYSQQSKDRELMQQIWQHIAAEQPISDTSIQLLVHLAMEFGELVENFYSSTYLKDTIRNLLESPQPAERKAGYYLLRQYVSAKRKGKASGHWMNYITILESLEENQSHLILPSLQLLKSLPRGRYSYWADLLLLLHKKILTHSNAQITQWAVDYFLQLPSEELKQLAILPYVLECLNNTRLYNYEGNILNVSKTATNFLQGDLTDLFMEMGDMNWKSVPLHFWLEHLSQLDTPYLYTETILNLASRVRHLQNTTIRAYSSVIVQYLFYRDIREMDLKDYCKLIEALSSEYDRNLYRSQFVKRAISEKIDQRLLTGRLYQILADSEAYAALTKKRQPQEADGDDTFNDVMPSLFRLYTVAVDTLPQHATFSDVFAVFQTAFDALDIKRSFARESAVNYYVTMYWHPEVADPAIDDLIEMSTTFAFSVILRKLQDSLFRGAFSPTETCNKCIEHFGSICGKDEHAANLGIHLAEFCGSLPKAERLEYFQKLYRLNAFSVIAHIPTEILVDNFEDCLYGECRSGDCRVEKIYSLKLQDRLCDNFTRRLEHVRRLRSCGVAEKLLQYNNELSKRKPRYFENSHEHLLKMRITRLIYQEVITEHFSASSMWSPILQENNQLNITYVYEICIAYVEANKDSIMDKLRHITDHTASVQVSLISIMHYFCTLHKHILSEEDFNEIVGILLPLTMGANFQVRLFTQLTLYSILRQTCNDQMSFKHVQTALERSVGEERINRLVDNDVRLQLHYMDLKNEPVVDIIAYITNAPIDEYAWNDQDVIKYDYLRKAFANRHNVLKSTDEPSQVEPPQTELSTNLQRKINPTKELLTQSSLISYPECEADNEMYVVASLIDKLPNLGGIARTCEVFGIKNLVLASKAFTQRSEFKNLSMSAENMLNIIEVKAADLMDFIMQKQTEGYNIVGAEQTVDSKSFVDFEFPKKCVLLLGHEKEGLPVNLIGFLDYAIEIPQFGMVRSLNVHVTGALFMWEYCKQHIVTRMT